VGFLVKYPSFGTAFEMTPQADGRWTENVFYRFGRHTTNGEYPNANLIWDAAGNHHLRRRRLERGVPRSS